LSLVLDASVALTWVYGDEETAETRQVLTTIVMTEAWVPAFWHLEVGNALQQGLRRGRIDQNDRDGGLADMADLPIRVDPHTSAYAWTSTLDLSTHYRLTIYDACYLELALRRTLPLATLDRELRRAAEAEGVPLLGI
jgi:predicted nucleic acid-binding protein